MLDGLARLARSLHEDGLATGWRAQGQLVERDDLAAGLENAATGLLGDVQGTDLLRGNAEFEWMFKDA